MKIVCDNCATKYSIADDKVRGKVFKIRCKKCSHIIVVRGTGDGAVSEPAQAVPSSAVSAADSGQVPKTFQQKETKVFDYEAAPTTVAPHSAVPLSDAPVWHLVIDREQVGPMTPGEVRQRFARGEVDAETFAWREGFGDWQKLSSLADFADLVTSGGASAADLSNGTEEGHGRESTSDLFQTTGQHDREAADDALFASAPPTTAESRPSYMGGAGGAGDGGGLFGASGRAAASAGAGAGAGGDLFAAPAAASPAAGGGLFAAVDREAASARAEVRPMTGQRNENSVLFSLNNLQALAMTNKADGGGAAAAQSKPAGYASNDQGSSGLIDIRAMAATTMAAKPSTGSSAAMDEELPAFGATPFSAAAPAVLLPMGAAGVPKWVWGLVAGGALLLIVAVVMLVVIMRRPAAPASSLSPTLAAAPTATTPPAPTPGTPGAAAAARPDDKRPGAAPEAPKPEEHAAEASRPKTRVASAGSRHHKGPAGATGADPGAMAAPSAPSPAPRSSGKKAGGDELDALLNKAIGGGGSTPAARPREEPTRAAAPAPEENLPEHLSPSQVQGAIARIKPKASACYAQYNVPGIVNISVTVSPAGRVSSATPTGKFAGTPTGECVARAAKSAGFPRFKGPSPTTFEYPFLLSK